METATAIQAKTATASSGTTSSGIARKAKKSFVLRIINESQLDKQEVEQLAQQLFGVGVKQLDKLQASQLIEELLEKTGQKGTNRRRCWLCSRAASPSAGHCCTMSMDRRSVRQRS